MPVANAMHLNDYSLVGRDSALAIEKGLAEASLAGASVRGEGVDVAVLA